MFGSTSSAIVASGSYTSLYRFFLLSSCRALLPVPQSRGAAQGLTFRSRRTATPPLNSSVRPHDAAHVSTGNLCAVRLVVRASQRRSAIRCCACHTLAASTECASSSSAEWVMWLVYLGRRVV